MVIKMINHICRYTLGQPPYLGSISYTSWPYIVQYVPLHFKFEWSGIMLLPFTSSKFLHTEEVWLLHNISRSQGFFF